MVNPTVYRKKSRVKTVLTEYLMLSLGTIIIGIGIYIFAVPNKFVMGGVTGLSILLSGVLPFSAASIAAVLNMALVLVGFAFLGRDFGFKTVYTTVLISVFGMAVEAVDALIGEASFLPLTNNLLLELLLAVILPGVGTAIVFYYNGSGGGTDVIAMVLKKYTKLESGKALLAVDFLIMIVSFTYGMEIGLLSALGLCTKSMIVDKVNRSMNLSKYFIIITTLPEEVGEYISKKLQRGGTMWRGVGVYTQEEKYIFLVVMNTRQAAVVRDDIKRIDEHAFIVVDDTSDIVGEGFRALM